MTQDEHPFGLHEDLIAIRSQLKELREAIQEHSKTIHGAQECYQQTEKVRNPTPVIVSYNEQTAKDTQTESDRQYRTQNAIKNWTKAAVVAASIYAAIAACQWWQMRKATIAATEAADISAKQFELVERPQISDGNMVLVQPVVIDRNGMRLNFKISFTNKGSTRAIKTFGAAEVFPLQLTGPEPGAARDDMCKLAEKNASTSRFSFVVYPGQQQVMAFSMPISRRDVDEVAQRTGFIVPAIIACIAYRPFFNDTSVYHTGFAEVLTYAPDPVTKQRKAIIPQDGTIPVDKLSLHETGVAPEISPD